MHGPTILFRADASMEIGTGHVARCLALAEHLVDRGWRTVFAGRMPDATADGVRAAGMAVHRLPDELPIAGEPAHLSATGILDDVDVVLSDHYEIGADWQRAVAAGGRAIAAIDDLATVPMAAQLLVNQNLGATPERYAALLEPGAVTLTGPRYAILRAEFAAARAAVGARDGRVRRVLVFLSGADEHDVTSRAAAGAAAAGIATDVVVGAAYPNRERLEAWAAGRAGVTLHVNTAAMSGLMADADLAVGAPSSASWERCCLGLPSVLVILADNQVDVAANLERAGAARVLGWHHEVTADRIAGAIEAMCGDRSSILAMGRAAATITDGLGAHRVADALEALVDRRPVTTRSGALP